MRIIEIAALDNGAHNDQTYHGVVPEGWAIMREGEKCENFPFGNFEVEDVNGVAYMVADSWEPLPLPEPETIPEAEPTQLDRIEAQVAYTAMMTDTLLEE